ncbi:MAG: PBP1A family penicillin-binding protein [Synergistales bacterium]|nr:PBP1A family penicillin-binding protein [Synergistales bacterium]
MGSTRPGTNSDPGSISGKPGFLKIFLYVLFFIFLGSIALGGAYSYRYIQAVASDLPTEKEILAHQASRASVIYDRNGEIIAKLFLEHRTPVVLSEISPWMIKATLAAEDDSFYKHPGLRIAAILRALWVDLMHKDVKQGGSTITQQLARNLFLTHDRTIERKVKELIIALRLEKMFSKDRILEMYLNTIYFGHGAWGIDTAAHTYFGKSPSELALPEAAMIAGLIAAPNRYSPLNNPENGKVRQFYVLDRLEELGWISAQENEQARNTSLVYSHTPNRAEKFNLAPYFVTELLFSHLLPKYGKEGVYRGGLSIYTTLDIRLQKAADHAIQQLETEGALVCIDPSNGDILAMTGGKDFKTSKFNRAVQAFREPGSAFKPFVYSAALEQGIMPTDHILDAPISFDHQGPEDKVWAPGNYTGEFHGEVTIVEALSHSYNTVSVRTAQMIGIGPVISMARKLGITSPHLPHDLSASLGSASLTPLELATAYCAFANNGMRVTPLSIRYIEDWNGEILENNDHQVYQAIPPETAVIMRSLLKEVVRAGTGTRCRIPGYEVFGKTGTTNEFMDAWFAGGVPGLVTVVYAGKDDHTSMGNKKTGGVVAGPVWKEFMDQAVQILPLQKEFPVPPGLDARQVRICKETGYLATGTCPGVDIYLPQHRIPVSFCPTHGGDHFMADNDPNAPRILLLPEDVELYERFAQVGKWDEWTYQPGINITTITREHAEEAPVVPLEPYRKDPSPAKDLEQRYQELLKEYGITD